MLRIVFAFLFFTPALNAADKCKPSLEINLDKDLYQLGEKVSVDFKLANPCTIAFDSELRSWADELPSRFIELPSLSPIAVNLPPASEQVFTLTFDLDKRFKDGSFAFSSALLHKSGTQIYAETLKRFWIGARKGIADDFERADHTSLGQEWTDFQYGNVFHLKDGRAATKETWGIATFAPVLETAKNYIVRTQVRYPARIGTLGLVARAGFEKFGLKSYYSFQCSNENSYHVCSLFYRYTLLAEVDTKALVDGSILEFEVNNDQLIGRIDDNEIISVVNERLQTGRPGLWSSGCKDCAFEDFDVVLLPD